ncbi:MAG: nitronate monooxygenase [Acidobacteriota bacterium]
MLPQLLLPQPPRTVLSASNTEEARMKFQNRITDMLGVEIPIVQAPMGYIARAQLASAVSHTGALGIIETSSGALDEIRGEISKMRELTEQPFGVNIAQAFIRDPSIIDFVIEQGVRFVTTSAGDPRKFTEVLKGAGLTVFHVVPSLKAALRAVEAGVDGLVVEGGEGGGFKNPREVSTMVLLPLVRSKVDVPIIAAGGVCDGSSMAAAFALGAEGVQLGTRMVSALESPIHDNWKQGIVDAEETDTVMLRGERGPALRALRTETTNRLEAEGGDPMTALGQGMRDVYFEGNIDNGVPLTGQVAGRIEAVRPVADIIGDMVEEFEDVVGSMGRQYAGLN